MSSPSPGAGNENSIRNTVVNALTTVSHVTTPFISTFLLVHLAAPVLANAGGTNLASQTMLLGREYYQTPMGEELLVWGPIVVHAVAGISKRLVFTSPSNKQSDPGRQLSKRRVPLYRPLTSILGLTGYATVLVFLPVHFLVHRYHPALPIEPISCVGPSSLDYEYVKYGLHTWPWRSWFFYAGIIGSVALHAADGSALIWNTWFGSGWGDLSRKTRRAIAIGGAIIPVLLGIVAMGREPPMITSFLANRYHAAYAQSFVFRV